MTAADSQNPRMLSGFAGMRSRAISAPSKFMTRVTADVPHRCVPQTRIQSLCIEIVPQYAGIVGPLHCWLFAQPLTSGKVISTRHKIADVLQKCDFTGRNEGHRRCGDRTEGRRAAAPPLLSVAPDFDAGQANHCSQNQLLIESEGSRLIGSGATMSSNPTRLNRISRPVPPEVLAGRPYGLPDRFGNSVAGRGRRTGYPDLALPSSSVWGGHFEEDSSSARRAAVAWAARRLTWTKAGGCRERSSASACEVDSA